MTRSTRRMFVARLAGAAFSAFLIVAAAATRSRGAEPRGAETRPDKFEFLRFKQDHQGGGTLETAIATYRNAAGVEVHLVAAVHVGEKSYYDGLAKTFDTYDALLYEMVKPKGAQVPGPNGRAADGEGDADKPHAGPQIRGAAAIGGLQGLLKNALKLDFQLDAIDYTRPNFVHADLDVETFNKLQEQRGESLFGLMLRSMLSEMSRQRAGEGAPAVTIFDILAAMKSPDSTRQYKLLLARQMGQIEAQLQGIEGESGSVLIAERNKAALQVLEKTIGEGKKSIGVFYGAGHMRGIEEQLVGKLGFKQTAIEWRIAWDMRTPDGAAKK